MSREGLGKQDSGHVPVRFRGQGLGVQLDMMALLTAHAFLTWLSERLLELFLNTRQEVNMMANTGRGREFW